MKIYRNPERETWKDICRRPAFELEFLESVVNNILNRVRISGDQALTGLTEQYDGVKITGVEVSQKEMSDAAARLSPELKKAIGNAALNIEKFHASQKREVTKVETIPGVTCWRKSTPIQSVGIYIPGGSAPLFSTVLMLGIPARLAGCREVILCSPPGKNGLINDAILYSANLVGVTRIFKAGGAQAIAALAYGTETIPAVSKIFGPGNQYVTKAKQMVNLQGTAIDIPAGPSEVMIIADGSADPSFIAADLLSQAEHGADSQVVLVTNHEAQISRVLGEIETQLVSLPRKAIVQQALSNSVGVLFSSDLEMTDFANEYAPEHLIINTVNCDHLEGSINNAGSIFLGPYAPESAGDYASGTNHTLPTGGFAKAYGGVSLESFMKYVTVQKLTKQGIRTLGPSVEIMASAEQLEAHRESISIRLRKTK